MLPTTALDSPDTGLNLGNADESLTGLESLESHRKKLCFEDGFSGAT